MAHHGCTKVSLADSKGRQTIPHCHQGCAMEQRRCGESPGPGLVQVSACNHPVPSRTGDPGHALGRGWECRTYLMHLSPCLPDPACSPVSVPGPTDCSVPPGEGQGLPCGLEEPRPAAAAAAGTGHCWGCGRRTSWLCSQSPQGALLPGTWPGAQTVGKGRKGQDLPALQWSQDSEQWLEHWEVGGWGEVVSGAAPA